jgi:DNA polymerase III delta prime subunit
MTAEFSVLDRSNALARLRDQARGGSLHPSLLLVGPEGSGKELAAIELAAELLRSPGNLPASGALFAGIEPSLPADSDVGVRKVKALAHPDLHWIFPAESGLTVADYRALLDAKAKEPLARLRQPGSAVIPIGDPDDPAPVSVRRLRRFVHARPFEARYRVGIVSDAHRMNRQSANALLKTLEEPPGHAILILCTHQPHLLPPTIRSRCARVNVPAFAEEELASCLRDRADVPAPEAARIAAVTGGNARRAFDLVDETARELADWAAELFSLLVDGRRADLARAAERVAKGQPPTGRAKKKLSADASLAANRDLNLRLLDFLVADLLALSRRDSGARLDRVRAESLPASVGIDPGRAARAARRLLGARSDLTRNVNVGLVVLAVLLDAERELHAIDEAAG